MTDFGLEKENQHKEDVAEKSVENKGGCRHIQCGNKKIYRSYKYNTLDKIEGSCLSEHFYAVIYKHGNKNNIGNIIPLNRQNKPYKNIKKFFE